MANNSLEVTLVVLNSIKPNDYNPNVVQEPIMVKLRAEIGQKGLCEPIIVRSRGDGYEIVDGYHRWLICKELGWKEVPCIIQDYDDNEARIKTIQLNYMRGSPVPIKLASLIHDLNKQIPLRDLAMRLPYEEVQLQDDLELLKLPDGFGRVIEEQARMEEQELPQVLTFVVYKKQSEIIEEALKIASKVLPEQAKNTRALALERICADSLVGHGVVAKSEDAAEPS